MFTFLFGLALGYAVAHFAAARVDALLLALLSKFKK